MKGVGFWVAIGLSGVYLVVVCGLLGGKIGNLAPNELGDFLAGVFTPLAFLWLVIGYFMQRTELGLQREELKHQREELALTRGQLGKQTELLQEQVTADYQESIPRLTLRIASPVNHWDWIIENKGGGAKNIELLNLNERQTVEERNSLARDESFRFTVETISATHSYEARFGSERSEGFINAGR